MHRQLMTFLAGIGALSAVATAVPPAHAAFPGRNGKIAYSESDGAISNGSTSDLGSIWSSGKARRTLADGSIDPAYSPSGRTLAFADDFGSGISIKRPERRRVRQITRGADFEPDFAPGGRRIVFRRASAEGPEDEIRIYHGGRSARLTAGHSPAWSPRGGTIAFERTSTDGARRSGIYTIGPDGRTLRFVTFGRAPDWSPSGRTLVFVTEAGRLATIRPSGAGLRRLTGRRGYSTPAFAPDGRSLAAVRTQGVDGESELVTIKPRTRRLRRVFSSEAGFSGRIDWRPRPRR